MSRAKHVFKKTGSKQLDAIVTKRSILVKPTKRKYQKEVLQILDHKRIKEFHRRPGKRSNGKFFVERPLEKKIISSNLNKFSNTEKFFYLRIKILSEDSLKTSKDQRLRHFSKLTRKVILEKTSKTKQSLEAKQYHKIVSTSILPNNDFQYNHCRKRYLQSLNSSPLVETTRDIPTKSSFENSRKTLDREQSFEVPRCNLQSNSSQHNGCGICNEYKPSQIEDRESLADESLCLKRSRNPIFKQHLCPT